jgi:hypothetical protein
MVGQPEHLHEKTGKIKEKTLLFGLGRWLFAWLEGVSADSEVHLDGGDDVGR